MPNLNKGDIIGNKFYMKLLKVCKLFCIKLIQCDAYAQKTRHSYLVLFF